jgi:outer membrane receptor protein involved in Fe transport
MMFGFASFGPTNNVVGNLNKIGAPPLRPQTIDSIELVTDAAPLSQERLTLQASVFYQTLHDSIQFVQSGSNFRAINQADSTSGGVEASAQSTVGRFSARLGGALQQQVGLKFAQSMPFYPALMIVASGDVHVPEIFAHLNVSVRYASPRDGPATSFTPINTAVPSRTVVDLALTSTGLNIWPETHGETRITFKISNLLDQHVGEPGYDSIYLPAIGRKFMVEFFQSF